tara:strand:- start:117 stop:323 length:207 start_codon:yes stop_codon:yes gene_type:complete
MTIFRSYRVEKLTLPMAVNRVLYGGDRPHGCSVPRWDAIVKHVMSNHGQYGDVPVDNRLIHVNNVENR